MGERIQCTYGLGKMEELNLVDGLRSLSLPTNHFLFPDTIMSERAAIVMLLEGRAVY